MKTNILIIGIVVALVIASIVIFYFYCPSTKEKEIDINKILSDTTEYTSSLYLKELSVDEQKKLMNDFDKLFYEYCKNGKIEGSCTRYFLLNYIQTRLYLGGIQDASLEETYTNYNLLKSTYLDLRGDYQNLTESDLNGFVVPLVTKYCGFRLYWKMDQKPNETYRSYLVNTTERMFWFDNIMNVNKTNTHSTEMQIYYSVLCLEVNNITDLSNVTGKNKEEIINKICNILPTMDSVNKNDICSVNDYLKVKTFCEISIDEEDRALMNDSLSANSQSYHQTLCKDSLSILSSII